MIVMALVAVVLNAQHLTVGVIGGAAVTDAARDITRATTGTVGSRVWSQSKDWVAGAALEVQFTPRWSVEVDGMYRLLHITWSSVLPDGSLNSVSPSPVVTWEFPVLAKYRLGGRTLRPFIEGGPAFRTTGNLNFEPSHYGVAAGGGFETDWKGLTISPTVRYTRWAEEKTWSGRAGMQPNQVELLVGFRPRSQSSFQPFGHNVSVGGSVGYGLTPDIADWTGPTMGLIAIPQPGGGYTYESAPATGYTRGLRSLIAGPVIEVHLPREWSVEVSALHKMLRSKQRTVLENGTAYPEQTFDEAATWQIPVLAKYRFGHGRWRPFVEGGPSFRLPQWSLATYGVTGGAGIEFGTGPVRVSPTVRYTHWSPESGVGASAVRRNEVAAVVNVTLGR